MPSIAIIDRQMGVIASFYEDEAPNQGKFGGPWGWPDSTVHIEVPSGMDKDVIRAVKVVTENTENDGSVVEVDSYTFEEDAEKVEAKTEREWQALRAERNRRLAETDWTMTLDAPLDDEKKAAMREYREMLRSLPEGIAHPKEVVWPKTIA
jgi:hypothetical protein